MHICGCTYGDIKVVFYAQTPSALTLSGLLCRTITLNALQQVLIPLMALLTCQEGGQLIYTPENLKAVYDSLDPTLQGYC